MPPQLLHSRHCRPAEPVPARQDRDGVCCYREKNYRGAGERLSRDEPDLSRVVRNGVNFDRAITSFRVR